GAQVRTSELLTVPDAGFPQSHFDTARAIGARLFVAKASACS
ncbi:NAD(P)H oxidoreductase, partial [Xanthomonas perforans]